MTVREARRAMAQAARAAKQGQAPAVLYDPGHAEALVVMRVGDLVTLMDSEAANGNTNEGRRDDPTR